MRLPATLVALLTLGALLSAPSAQAAAVHVHCPPDDLQAAIDAASAGDVLVIHGTCEGTFVLDKNVRLRGRPGATLDGSMDMGTVLEIDFGVSTKVSDLTITGGSDVGLGGGIQVRNSATLRLRTSTVIANTTGSFGGGINNQGTLFVYRSVIVGNHADAQGGGIGNDGTLEVRNSTVSGNDADDGGGIANIFGSILLRNVTIANNTAVVNGGGIWGPNFTVGNTILGDNTAPSGPDCSASMVSEGGNVIENPMNCTSPGASDVTGQDPRLFPLRDNGGPTRTHRLRSTSPARDAAEPAISPPEDQRGARRRGSDSGAYELVRCKGIVVNVVGTNRGERLVGTPGRDGVHAYEGDDIIETRAGRDGICAHHGDDFVDGGRGPDLINAGRGVDWVLGRKGGDVIRGWRDDDFIFGGPGHDVLLGDNGDDTLRGQQGDDALFGGAGFDTCSQGPGSGPVGNCEAS